MTGAVIVGGLILLVVGALAFARISAAWAERRSIETYGRALGALGDVARRGETSGNVRIIASTDIGGAHVKPGAGTGGELPPTLAPRAGRPAGQAATVGASAGARDIAACNSLLVDSGSPVAGPSVAGAPAADGSRFAPVVSVQSKIPRISLPVPPQPWHFEDDSLRPAEAAQLPDRRRGASDERRRQASARRRAVDRRGGGAGQGGRAVGDHRRRPEQSGPAPESRRSANPTGESRRSEIVFGRPATLRRVATGAAAAVALVLAVVGVVQVTGGGQHAHRLSTLPPAKAEHRARSNPASAPRRSGGSEEPGGVVLSPFGAAHRLVPTSTTPSDVSFEVPSRKYLLTFSDSGASNCWVGVETAAGSNDWLWMDTLVPGTTTSYEASGPVVVVLGAPKNIELRVNGLAAELPAYSVSYDLSFSTGTTSA